jgi:hypothetical protein
VSFYDGDPRLAGKRLGGAVTTAYLHPGEYEDVTFVLPRSRTTRKAVFVSADDSGGLKGRIVEADEENNLYDSGEALTGAEGQPDLVVVNVDVSGASIESQSLAVSGEASARVRNQTAVVVTQPFEVAFFEDRDGDETLGPADAVLGQAVRALRARSSSGAVPCGPSWTAPSSSRKPTRRTTPRGPERPATSVRRAGPTRCARSGRGRPAPRARRRRR